jgi:hypothetical protein
MAQSIRHALPLRIIYISMVHLSWRCIACAAPQHENLIWQSWQCPFAALGLQKGVGSADGQHFRDCSTKMLCRTFRTWHATNWANGHGTHCPRGRVCIRGFERVGRLVAFGIIGLFRWVQVCMPRHIGRRVDRRPLLLPLPAHVCCI